MPGTPGHHAFKNGFLCKDEFVFVLMQDKNGYCKIISSLGIGFVSSIYLKI